MSINVTVSIDAKQVVQALGRIEGVMEKQFPLRTNAACVSICQGLMARTYPVVNNDPKTLTGGTDAGIKQGIHNVVKDVHSAFGLWRDIPVGSVIMSKNQDLLWNLDNPIDWYTPSLADAWEKRDFNTLFNTFQRAGWEAEDKVKTAEEATVPIYDKLRDSSGKLKTDSRRYGGKVYVRSEASINSVIAQKVAHIGKMYGGWVDCIKDLRGITGAVDLGQGKGSATTTNAGLDIGISITNEYGDFNGMMSKTGEVDRVVNDEMRVLNQKIDSDIQDAILDAHGVLP
jgi:hypothetical protein